LGNPSRSIVLLAAAVLILACSTLKGRSEIPLSASATADTAPAAGDIRTSKTQTISATPTADRSKAPSRTHTVTPIAVEELKVPADVVWLNTKVKLLDGQYIEIRAWGKSNISGVPGNDIWNPDGDQGYCPSDCLMPGAGYGMLIGKFPGGLPFKIGSFLKMEVKADAVLLLAINDNEPYYFDNTGSYSIRITVWNHRPAGV
jgi:hypothetical protein